VIGSARSPKDDRYASSANDAGWDDRRPRRPPPRAEVIADFVGGRCARSRSRELVVFTRSGAIGDSKVADGNFILITHHFDTR
jgi:hypothetical protein